MRRVGGTAAGQALVCFEKVCAVGFVTLDFRGASRQWTPDFHPRWTTIRVVPRLSEPCRAGRGCSPSTLRRSCDRIARCPPQCRIFVAEPSSPAITAAQVAWCGQVRPGKRHSWARQDRLKQHPPFTTHDAVETALAFRLADSAVSQKIATAAWESVRAEIKRLIVAGEEDIWFVVAAEGPRHAAVAGANDAARAGEQLGPCWLVSAQEVVVEAKMRFAELRARGTGSASVSRLPDRKNA